MVETTSEKWKDVIGYEGLYRVSNKANVKGLKRNAIVKSHLSNKGYFRINLCKNGISRSFSVHRLMAIAFIPNPENKKEVNHINEIRNDNILDNLEWVTKSENLNHGTALYRRSLKAINGKASKPVNQYSLDNKFIKRFPSISEAQRNGFTLICISKCCRGIRNKHAGFKWQYA